MSQDLPRNLLQNGRFLECILWVIFFFILFIFAYIRIRYPFWSLQPVFHTYDVLRRWTREPGAISTKWQSTKFWNPARVKTQSFLDLDNDDMARLLNLLQCYYVSSERVTFTIDDALLRLLCSHHVSAPCWVSFHQPLALVDKLDGGMIAYPVRMVTAFGDPQMTSLFYWEFIVGTSDDLTMRSLIQTHEANQRRYSPEILASLFRKDVALSEGIVPLVSFTVTHFELVKSRIQRPPLMPHCTVTKVQPDVLIDLLFDLTQSPFDLLLFPDWTAWQARIEHKHWFVYSLQNVNTQDILALYVFRDSRLVYEDGGSVLECMATMSFLTPAQDKLFFAGWLHALYDILQFYGGGGDTLGLAIPNLGHNAKLIQSWTWKYQPISTYEAAFYLYNYVVPEMPLAPDKCWIVL